MNQKTSIDHQQCAKEAEWCQQFHRYRDRMDYKIPVRQGMKIFEKLGYIKKKNDNRWEWSRKPSKFHKEIWDGNNEQGVCKTKQEAMNKVLEGWC